MGVGGYTVNDFILYLSILISVLGLDLKFQLYRRLFYLIEWNTVALKPLDNRKKLYWMSSMQPTRISMKNSS